MVVKRTGRQTPPSVPPMAAFGQQPAASSAASTIDKSGSVLADIMGKTDAAVASVENQPRTVVDLASEFAKLGQKFDTEAEEAVRTGDVEALRALMESAKEKILHGTLGDLNVEAGIEQADLATVLATFNTEIVLLDKEFENVDEPPAEAQALVTNAEQAIAEAKEAITAAKNSFFFRRGSRVSKAEEQLAEAEANLETAKADAKTLASQRLREANFEQSFQRIQLLATKIAGIMRKCLETTKQRQAITAERRKIALGLKAEAAEALEHVSKQHTEAEDRLRTEQEKLQGLTNGTKAYVEQEGVIADARALVEDLNGKRTAATAILQSKERFVMQHELFEAALQKVGSNLRAMIAVLESDTEERIHTFASRLQTQKAAQQQEAGLRLTKIGREQDQRNLVAGAAFAMQADRAQTQLLESQKGDLARIAATVAGFEEAHAQVRARMQIILKETSERYGLDIKDEQYLTYADEATA